MGDERPLVPMFIPSLVSFLLNREKAKGSPLTEAEVLEIRDKGACIMLPLTEAARLEQARGYRDLDPERCWEEWQEARKELGGDEPSR